MTTYAGFEVLDAVEHNRLEGVGERVAREFIVVGPEAGAKTVDVPSKSPAPARPFRWTCRTPAAAAAMRAFLIARSGMRIPFWLPSWQKDLSLAADLTAGATIVLLRRRYYARLMFPHLARRHLAFHLRGGALAFRKVVDADDPGTGTTETLTIASSLPINYPAATALVMYLKLVRLEEDETEIRWYGGARANANLRVREVPNEVPA